MSNFSNQLQNDRKKPGPMGKIDKLGLGPRVVYFHRQFPGKWSEIMKAVNNEYEKDVLSLNDVKRYIIKNNLPTEPKEVIKQNAQLMLAEDKDKMLKMFEIMLGDSFNNYKQIRDDPSKTPEEKLSAIDTIMKAVMNRGLDGVGYGKNNTQVNIQNNVIVTETMDRLVDFLARKFNGESSDIIAELRSSIELRS